MQIMQYFRKPLGFWGLVNVGNCEVPDFHCDDMNNAIGTSV